MCTKEANTAARYISTNPILDLHKKTLQIPGMWVVKRWWDKEVLDLVGAFYY